MLRSDGQVSNSMTYLFWLKIMIKYLLLLCIYMPFYLLAMLVAPVLPLFAELRNGPIDNTIPVVAVVGVACCVSYGL